MFILNYLPHGLIGLLVVAILAAAMSSLSSAINSLSAVTIEDYCRITNKELSQGGYLKLAKYMGLVWGAITLVLSLYAGNIAPTIIEAINKVGSLFYGPILAVFLLAVLTKSTSGLHVNIGLISGVLFNLLISMIAPEIFWFWWNFIGFVVTIVMAMMMSKIKPFTYQPSEEEATAAPVSLSILTTKDIALLLGMFAAMIAFCLYIPTAFV